MAYVPVPKDLNAVKTKVMFNLTKRQLICFSLGGLVGLPMFFLIKSVANPTLSTLALMVICFPFFMFAMFERHGRPLEVLLRQMYLVKFGVAKERPYQSHNFYELLEKQYNLNEEVNNVVKKSRERSAFKGRAQGNRTNSRKV